MTTHTSNGTYNHSTDADFRAWATELHNGLLAVGMVATADTGQADFTTATRPATNQQPHYRVYAFPASTLQTAAPLFLRVNFGTGLNAAQPAIATIVGNATNGAGTVSGVAPAAIFTSHPTTIAAGSTATFNSYFCRTDDFLGFVFKVGSGNTANLPSFSLGLCRTSDSSTGTGTSDGYFRLHLPTVSGANSGTTFQSVFNSTSFNSTQTGSVCTLIPGDYIANISGTIPIFPVAMVTPTPRIVSQVIEVPIVAYGLGVTFTATMLGTTPRTYITLRQAFGQMSIAAGAYPNAGNTTTGINWAMLWE